MSYALNVLSEKSVSLNNQMGDTGEENPKTLQTSYSLFNSKYFTVKLTCVDNTMFTTVLENVPDLNILATVHLH